MVHDVDESLQIKPDSQVLGDILAVERNRQKLSQKQVAEQLNLNQLIINALENDLQIENISSTYVRGYQRAYIRLLGLDENELLSNLVEPPVEQLQEQMHYLDKSLDLNRGKSNFRFLPPLLVMACLIAAAVYSWPKLTSVLENLDNSNDSVEKTINSDTVPVETITQTQTTIEIEKPASQPATENQIGTVENDIDVSAIQENDQLATTLIETDIDFTNLSQSGENVEAEQINEVESLTQVQTNQANSTVDLPETQSQEGSQESLGDIEIVTQVIEIQNDINNSLKLSEAEQTELAAIGNASVDDVEVATKITQILNLEQNLDDNNNNDDIDVNEENTELSGSQQENEAKITFVSNGESWLSISDADNNRLYRNTLKLDRVIVTGKLPLYVSTGNVNVLRLHAGQGEQQKVDIFSDKKTVAKFYVELDANGGLKFSPK